MSVQVHAQDSRGVPGPSRIGPGLAVAVEAPVPGAELHNALPAPESRSSPLPASQESLQSSASKQTAFTSVEPVDDRQLTPTTTSSRQDSSSPFAAGPVCTNAPSGALASYESLPAYETAPISPRLPSLPSKAVPPYRVDTTAGQKRKADGTIKTSRASSADSPINGPSRHGRTTSTASRSSQLGELSAQLKARLTYAKVKVDHGWESRTLKEIETLASQPASPASIRTDSTRAFRSPHNNKGDGTQQPNIAHFAKEGDAPTIRPLTAPSRQLHYGQPADEQQRPNGSHLAYVPTPPPPSRGSLAPPVDLGNPRRTQQGVHHVPGLATTGSHSTLSASSHGSTRSPFPHTPPVHPDQSGSSKIPTQRTMEQDAIETLLFMRSPGNSANFAHNKQSAFPLHSSSAVQQAGHPAVADRSGVPVGHAHPAAPQPRAMVKVDVDAIPLSPPRRRVEEHVLPGAQLHDSRGIDSALDEIRRRAAAHEQEADSSDEEHSRGSQRPG